MLDSIILPTATAIKITSGTILHEMKPDLFMIVDFIEYKTIFTSIFNVAKPVQLSS